MAIALKYSAPMPPVNMECSNLKEEWQRSINSFEMFSTASKLDNEDDKVQRAALLHLAGPAVQTVLSNLTGDKTSTKNVKDRLTEFFALKANKWAERYRFKCRAKQLHESTDKFVPDLRKLGSTGSFADLEEHIISQIIEKCHNPQITEKLLTEGDGLSLEKAMTLARTFEQTQESAAMMNCSLYQKLYKSNLRNHQFPSENQRKAIVIKNVLRVARQDISVVPPSARPRTLPVDSARRKGTLTQSAGRSLHES